MNKLWRAPIKGHGLPYQLDFIYLEPGGTVPEHDHKGSEFTLVLEGDFCDEQGRYPPGSIIEKQGKEQHTPYSDTGCLCLAAIDAPLHFTSGMARLLNPFSQFFFQKEA
jgi:putative transcriptional regulator